MNLKNVLHDIVTEIENLAQKEFPTLRSDIESLGVDVVESVVHDVTTALTPTPETTLNPAGGIPPGGLHPDATAATTPKAAPESAPKATPETAPEAIPEATPDATTLTDSVTITGFLDNATPEELSSLAAFIEANYRPATA